MAWAFAIAFDWSHVAEASFEAWVDPSADQEAQAVVVVAGIEALAVVPFEVAGCPGSHPYCVVSGRTGKRGFN